MHWQIEMLIFSWEHADPLQVKVTYCWVVTLRILLIKGFPQTELTNNPPFKMPSSLYYYTQTSSTNCFDF